MQEVLRMYPPVGIGQIRVSHSHDLVLCGEKLAIPRGTLLWVPHHAMHNAATNWDLPSKFLPGEMGPLLAVKCHAQAQSHCVRSKTIPHHHDHISSYACAILFNVCSW